MKILRQQGLPCRLSIGCFALILSLSDWAGAAFGADLKVGKGAPEIPVERLLLDFSTPALKAESPQILVEIFARIKRLEGQKHVRSAIHYLEQLEPARLGRTFSLCRSPQKQDQDIQLFKQNWLAIRQK